jgi:hypothetical protein
MTEAEWHRCTEPSAMLLFLRAGGNASERKLRLFDIACCRGLWKWMKDKRSRAGIRVAECFADELAGASDFERAREGTLGAWSAASGENGWHIHQIARAAAYTCGVDADTLMAVSKECFNAARNSACARGAPQSAKQVEASEKRRQAGLLRCVFGACAFHSVSVDNSILYWNDGVVRKLATEAYKQRCMPKGTLDNGRLAVLADALEDAGCTNANLLGHLRGPGPHVRGCWALDLILSRE